MAYTVNDEEQRNQFMNMVADENIGYIAISGLKNKDGKSQIPNSVTKVGEGSSTTSEIDGILKFIDWKKKDIFDLIGIITNNSGDKTSYTNQGQSDDSIGFAKTIAKDFATNVQIAFRLIDVEIPTKSKQENLSPIDKSDEESSATEQPFGEAAEEGAKDDPKTSE
ncbi:unnamed protein product [Didymodactylos carnosus]|uniref:Uncharacterized protein n=1 Tax=Didymodactylos carnosus TaxID=1234261 RepID=A0A8S2DB38_9BILA|nr:unnamed protein product [Didymodactylos carnosus]CAF3670359.1 unnamed protein product [Didymodactylos carnosus]